METCGNCIIFQSPIWQGQCYFGQGELHIKLLIILPIVSPHHFPYLSISSPSIGRANLCSCPAPNSWWANWGHIGRWPTTIWTMGIVSMYGVLGTDERSHLTGLVSLCSPEIGDWHSLSPQQTCGPTSESRPATKHTALLSKALSPSLWKLQIWSSLESLVESLPDCWFYVL